MSDLPPQGAHGPHDPQIPPSPPNPFAPADPGGERQPGAEPVTEPELSPARRADPGSRGTLLISLLLATVLFLVTAYLQNRAPDVVAEEEPAPVVVPDGDPDAAGDVAGDPDSAPAAAPVVASEPAAITPPGADQFTITARLFLKMRTFVMQDPNSVPQLDDIAVTDAERVRMAVVAAELQGYEEATERALGMTVELQSTDPELALDAELFAQIYSAGDDTREGVDSLTDDERDRLLAHHGFFAELALTAGLDDDDPAREPLISGGLGAMLFFVLVFGGIGLALLTGFVLGIIAIVCVATGRVRWRMPVPERGGSVYVEMFAIFIAGFLAMKLSSEALAAAFPDAGWVGLFPLVAQWLLLLTIFWPLVRGMDAPRFAGTIGFHRGEGVFREIGCGIFAYLAALPLYVMAVLVVLVLIMISELISGTTDEAPPSNPLFELIGGSPWWVVAMVFLLATVWAPLVEEAIFRGGLYRFTRSYIPAWIGAPLAAVPFAFLHNYGPLFTPPLIALGLAFGLMREWRGSLIAPITAHFLHNATVLTLLIVTVRLIAT